MPPGAIPTPLSLSVPINNPILNQARASINGNVFGFPSTASNNLQATAANAYHIAVSPSASPSPSANYGSHASYGSQSSYGSNSNFLTVPNANASNNYNSLTSYIPQAPNAPTSVLSASMASGARSTPAPPDVSSPRPSRLFSSKKANNMGKRASDSRGERPSMPDFDLDPNVALLQESERKKDNTKINQVLNASKKGTRFNN